jgi:hypothetical protein
MNLTSSRLSPVAETAGATEQQSKPVDEDLLGVIVLWVHVCDHA